MRNEINVNKGWLFSEAQTQSENKVSDAIVKLPFFHSCATMPEGSFSYTWVPSAELEEKTVYLEFSQISGDAEILCNGKALGVHNASPCPFRVLLTLEAHTDEIYEICVKVKPAPRADGLFSFAGVNLIAVDSSHFNMTDYGKGVLAEARLWGGSVSISLSSAIIRPNNYDVVSYTLKNPKGDVLVTKTCKPTVPDTVMTLELPEWWDGQTGPAVYTLEAQLLRDSRCLDRVVLPLGFREIKLYTDGFLYLNGVRLPLNGVRLSDCSAVKSDIENIKLLDGNILLSSLLPSKTDLLSVCDSLGVLFWYEPGFSGDADGDCEVLKEFLLLNRHHPSLSGIVLDDRADDQYTDKLKAVLTDIAPDIILAVKRDISDSERPVPEKADVVLLSVPCRTDSDSFIVFNGTYQEFTLRYPEKFFAVIAENPPKNELNYLQFSEWHIRLWNSFCRQKGIIAFFGGLLSDGRTTSDKRGLTSFDRTVLYDAFWYYKSQFSSKGFIKICEINEYETLDKYTDIRCITNCSNIRLLVNGRDKKYKPEKITDGVYLFRQIKLKKDENLIEVSAGEECDSVEITRF